MKLLFLLIAFLLYLSGSEQTSIPRKRTSAAVAASISLITTGIFFFGKVSCNGLYCLSPPPAPPSPLVIHADFYLRCTAEDYLGYHQSTIVQCSLNSSNPVEVFPSLVPPENKVFELRQKDLAHQAQLRLILENLNKPSPELSTTMSSIVRLVPDNAKHFVNHARAVVAVCTRSVWRKVKHLPAWAEKQRARANKEHATIYERGSELILRALKSISVWLEDSVRDAMDLKKSSWILQSLGNFILHKLLLLHIWNSVIGLFKTLRSCYLRSLPYVLRTFHACRPVVCCVCRLLIRVLYSVLKFLTLATLCSIRLILRALFWSAERMLRVCIASPTFLHRAFEFIRQISWGCTTSDDRQITLPPNFQTQNAARLAIEPSGEEPSNCLWPDFEIRPFSYENDLFKGLVYPQPRLTETMRQFMKRHSSRYTTSEVPSCFSAQSVKGDSAEGDNTEEYNVEGDNIEEYNIEGDTVEGENFERDNVEGDIDYIAEALSRLEIRDNSEDEQTPEIRSQPTSKQKGSKRVAFPKTLISSTATYSPDLPVLTIKPGPSVQEKGLYRPEPLIHTTVCSAGLVPEPKKVVVLAEMPAPSSGTVLSATLVSPNHSATAPIVDNGAFTPSADAILTSSLVKQPRKTSQSVQHLGTPVRRSPPSKRFDRYRRPSLLKKRSQRKQVSALHELSFANMPYIANVPSASNGPSLVDESTTSNVPLATIEPGHANLPAPVNSPSSASELFPSDVTQRAISQSSAATHTQFKGPSTPRTSCILDFAAPQPCILGASSVLDFCKEPREQIREFPMAVKNKEDQTDEMETPEDYTRLDQAAAQIIKLAAPAPGFPSASSQQTSMAITGFRRQAGALHKNKEEQTDAMDTSDDEICLGQAAAQTNTVAGPPPPPPPTSLSASSQQASTTMTGSGYQIGVPISFHWTTPPPQPYNIASAMNSAVQTSSVQPTHSGTAPLTSFIVASSPNSTVQSHFPQTSLSSAFPPTPLSSTFPAISRQGPSISLPSQPRNLPQTPLNGVFPAGSTPGVPSPPVFQPSTVLPTSLDSSVNSTPQMLFSRPAQSSTIQPEIFNSAAPVNHAPQGSSDGLRDWNFQPIREKFLAKRNFRQKSRQWIDTRKGSSLTFSMNSTPPTSSIVAPDAKPSAPLTKPGETNLKTDGLHTVAIPKSDTVEMKNEQTPTHKPLTMAQYDEALRIAAEKNKKSPTSGEPSISAAKDSVKATNPNLKVILDGELKVATPLKETKAGINQASSSNLRSASSQTVPSSSPTISTPPKIPGLGQLPLDQNQLAKPPTSSSTGIATLSSGNTPASWSGVKSSQRISASPRPSAGRPKRYMRDSIWSVKKQPMTDKEIGEAIGKEEVEAAKKKAADSSHTNAGNYFLATFPNGHEIIGTPAENLRCGLYAIMESMGAQFSNLHQPRMTELEDILRHPQLTQNNGVTGMSNTVNFTTDQLAAILHFWGKEHGLNLDLAYICERQDPLIIRASDNTAEERRILWIYNDNAAALANAEGFDNCGLLNHWSGLKPLSKAEAERAKIKALTAELEKMKEEMRAKIEEKDSESAESDFGSEIDSHSSQRSELDHDRGCYSDSGTNCSLNSDSDPDCLSGSESNFGDNSNCDSNSTSYDGSDPGPADDWQYSPPGSPQFPSWSPQLPPLNDDSGSDSGSDISEFLLPETETEHHVDVPGITTQFLDPDDEGLIIVYPHWAMTTANGQKWIKKNAQWLRNHRKHLTKGYPEMKDQIMTIITRDNIKRDKLKEKEAEDEAEANKNAF